MEADTNDSVYLSGFQVARVYAISGRIWQFNLLVGALSLFPISASIVGKCFIKTSFDERLIVRFLLLQLLWAKSTFEPLRATGTTAVRWL